MGFRGKFICNASLSHFWAAFKCIFLDFFASFATFWKFSHNLRLVVWRTTKCSLDFVTSISTQAYAKVSTVPGKNNTNPHRPLRGETRLPTVLGVCSRSSEWVFLALYTATLGRQSLLFLTQRPNARSSSFPSENLPLSYSGLGALCHKSDRTRPALVPSYVSSLDLDLSS